MTKPRQCPECGSAWPPPYLKRELRWVTCDRCLAERTRLVDIANKRWLEKEQVRFEAMQARAAQRTPEEAALFRESARAMFG